MLRPSTGASLVLRDFHPVSTKLLTKPGNSKKWKLTGSYFDDALVPSAVAYSKHSGTFTASAGAGSCQEAAGAGTGSCR